MIMNLIILKKIEIDLKPYNKSMIIKNCEYRRFLYNECVKHIKDIQTKYDTDKLGIPSNYLLYYIRAKYEKNILDNSRPEWLEDYDYYFRGISECVVDDVISTCNCVITNRQKGLSSDINFIDDRSSDMTFRFKNKLHRESQKNSNGLYYGNRLLIDINNPYMIGLKINNTGGYLAIEIKESILKVIDDPLFDMNEIREICIKCHNDVWVLCLQCGYNHFQIVKDDRFKIAGIDLGEKNPVVIFNGKKIIKIPKHLQYPKDAIKKYNQKIENCQRIMRHKYNKDLADAGLPQSKRYYKVLRKFHKYWERHNNILKDWHFKLAHWIVTHYKNIVVDEFHNHIISLNSDMLKTIRKRMNRSMHDKSMFDFTQRLIHMCHKYGTNYFKVIKNDCIANVDKPVFETTNTCSKCGNDNINKLTLNQRIFKCESCGYTIDRDVNAAINCYNLYKNKSTRNLFLELI